MTTSADVVTDERLAEIRQRMNGNTSYPDTYALAVEDRRLLNAELLALRRQLREAVPALEAGGRLCFALPGRDKSMALYSDYAASLRALAAKGKGV